ncbi:MAG TPA: HesA/MoeB/ThiF family protein [Candidatus Lokiarchaeia archaeon]|nr:HesA/MoeB/ThiF family protein [Candidatus Lokiarchaeia archaeon]
MLGLNDDEINRYSRHILLEEVGGKGQVKLKNATVGIAGCGGLGNPAIQVLAAAGIGTLKIADGDRIDITNLPRQFLFGTDDVGRWKTEVIEEKVHQANENVAVTVFNGFLDKATIAPFLEGCNYVIEASDNLATKFLINDACVHFSIPLTIAGVVRTYGQILSVIPGQTACYRCIFGEPTADDGANSCSAVGVLNSVPALAGVLQANEAIKAILELPTRLAGNMFLFNLIEDSYEFITVKKNDKCKACSKPEDAFYLEETYGTPDNSCSE